jgi:hypothetical protein
LGDALRPDGKYDVFVTYNARGGPRRCAPLSTPGRAERDEKASDSAYGDDGGGNDGLVLIMSADATDRIQINDYFQSSGQYRIESRYLSTGT